MKKEISYEELHKSVKQFVVKKYGNITAFINHKDFETCGWMEKDKVKLMNLLSSDIQKSFVTLNKIAKNLMEIKLEQEIKTTRTTKIYLLN